MTNTINVPRELLADLLGNDHDKRTMAERHLLAMLANAPSPAGVDGLETIGYATESELAQLLDPTMPTGKYVRIGLDHPTCWKEDAPYEHLVALCVLSDASTIIDGLRGENEAFHAQVKVLQSDANSWQSGYDEGRRMGGKHCALTIDRQAQRIGELEGLLREVAATLAWNAHGECRAIHDGPIMPSQMAIDAAKAALSAGKE